MMQFSCQQVNPMGSVVSLDPDRLNEKNEARLRKLKAISGEHFIQSTYCTDKLWSMASENKEKTGHNNLKSLVDDYSAWRAGSGRRRGLWSLLLVGELELATKDLIPEAQPFKSQHMKKT